MAQNGVHRIRHKRFLRLRQSLIVFILDLDFFKRINDQFGQVAGDQRLKLFIMTVQQQIREIDLLGRLGGEEFVVILDDTPQDKATQIGQRILQVVRATAFDPGMDSSRSSMKNTRCPAQSAGKNHSIKDVTPGLSRSTQALGVLGSGVGYRVKKPTIQRDCA
ncbi:MAG: GGDEF domain-containing protein [Halothiobacillus sp.]